MAKTNADVQARAFNALMVKNFYGENIQDINENMLLDVITNFEKYFPKIKMFINSGCRVQYITAPHIVDLELSPCIPFLNAKVREHIGSGKRILNPMKIRFEHFLNKEKKEINISGIETRNRAKKNEKLTIYGSNDLDHILKHQDDDEWKIVLDPLKKKEIYFLGTIFSADINRLYIRFMYYCDKSNRWDHGYNWQAIQFDENKLSAIG